MDEAHMSTPFLSKLMPFAAAGTAASPMQAALRSVSAISRTTQTAGIEWADFTRQSYGHGKATLRQLAEARDPRTALAIQADFMKGSYARFSAQARLIGELYAGLTSDLTKDLGRQAAPAARSITKA